MRSFTFSMAGTRFNYFIGYRALMTINEINNLNLADSEFERKTGIVYGRLYLQLTFSGLCTTDERAFRTSGMIDSRRIRVRDSFSVPTFSCATVKFFGLNGL